MNPADKATRRGPPDSLGAELPGVPQKIEIRRPPFLQLEGLTFVKRLLFRGHKRSLCCFDLMGRHSSLGGGARNVDPAKALGHQMEQVQVWARQSDARDVAP